MTIAFQRPQMMTSVISVGQLTCLVKASMLLDRNGETLTKEQTISLKAGDSRDLSFDFDGDKIADNR